MANTNYIFVDGSALLADIKRLRAQDSSLAGKKLDLAKMAREFTNNTFRNFIGEGWRRFTFYFVRGDERLEHDLVIPDVTKAGAVEDLRIEHCGKTIREFREAQKWLEENNAPQSVRDCLYRAEKAVDTQICADALQLAAVGKLDRLFLYTNDYDFIPLCRALRNLGLNINLFRLRAQNVNKELAQECDAVNELTEERMRYCFGANAA